MHSFNFFYWITILQYALVHCNFEINIVINTRKNGQSTSVWKKDLNQLWSPSKFRNFFSRSKSQNSTSNILAPQQPRKHFENNLKSLHFFQGLIRSISPSWASNLIQIFLPDTCEPSSKKVYFAWQMCWLYLPHRSFTVLNEKWGGGQQHLIMTRHLISKWHFYVNLACKSEQLIKIWLQNALAPGWQWCNLQPNLWTWFKLDRFTHVVLVWQLESVTLVEFWKQLYAICHHWI